MGSMETAVIVDALRTPIGRYGGALKDVRPDDLAALVVGQAVERNALDPAGIEDVYFGDANQAGEDNRNVARMAVLLAGLPVEIPAATMNRLCGSGMQAVVAATREIETGNGECFLAGGVESMTRAPYILEKPQRDFPRGSQTLHFIQREVWTYRGRIGSRNECADDLPRAQPELRTKKPGEPVDVFASLPFRHGAWCRLTQKQHDMCGRLEPFDENLRP